MRRNNAFRAMTVKNQTSTNFSQVMKYADINQVIIKHYSIYYPQ